MIHKQEGALVALLLALWMVPVPPASAAGWPADHADPRPAPGDVALPMPCGGQMVFRRVETFGPANWLADQKVRLGTGDPDLGFREDLRFDHVVGGLSTGGKPDRRHFLMGKYEVSVAQYAAVMAGCDALPAQGGLPKDDAGWFDAIDFTRRYNEWLLANHKDKLPVEDGARGFIRLPTEVEWEFAARGGNRVQPAQEVARTFPMEGPLADYVAHADPRSCDGMTQFIGSLKPNPLGLHDMLGNVAEIVMDPYRSTAQGRLHGQVGGFVVRGGSCLTSANDVRTAERHEEPFFAADTGGVRRPPFTGFRVMVGIQVATSQSRIDALKADARRGAQAAAPAAAADLPAAARALAVQAPTPAMADSLNRLASEIGAEMRRRTEIEADGARMAVRSAAMLMRGYRDEMKQVDGLEQQLKLMGAELRARGEETRDAYIRRAQITGEAYLSHLVSATETFGAAALRQQLPQVEAALDFPGAEGLRAMTRRFVQHAQTYQQKRPADLSPLLADCRRPLE
ncbi:formylglycine-generating enzyme family protein [Niveispirillum irakense]|uniref:formylglycine-generating enzyme family protein n=1 Tax=Niveispirillum irakense TaxID=34011 RepID=UPI0003F78FB4|nr:SUMF1/EgtB/PvdO family nonheme iron enzyme [Niveispirillum irakense]